MDESKCQQCSGEGRRMYGSTATWKGGIGGQAMTEDVCDKCWGTGSSERTGANLKVLFARLTQAEGRADQAERERDEARAEARKWKRIRTPTHGSCCTCQACGEFYDECRCDLDDVADDLAQVRDAAGRLGWDSTRCPLSEWVVNTLDGMGAARSAEVPVDATALAQPESEEA